MAQDRDAIIRLCGALGSFLTGCAASGFLIQDSALNDQAGGLRAGLGGRIRNEPAAHPIRVAGVHLPMSRQLDTAFGVVESLRPRISVFPMILLKFLKPIRTLGRLVGE